MLLSKLIVALQQKLADEGDVTVYTLNDNQTTRKEMRIRVYETNEPPGAYDPKFIVIE